VGDGGDDEIRDGVRELDAALESVEDLGLEVVVHGGSSLAPFQDDIRVVFVLALGVLGRGRSGVLQHRRTFPLMAVGGGFGVPISSVSDEIPSE